MFSFFQKPRCEVCSIQNANNVLIVPRVEGRAARHPLCRPHFFDEYKKVFLSHPYKMIVTYPVLDKKYSVYGYYDVSELTKYAYEDADKAYVRNLIGNIPADKECAYYDAITSQTHNLGSGLGMYPSELPINKAQFISKRDAWSNIYSALAIRELDFNDGFTVPYGKEGIFLTTFL